MAIPKGFWLLGGAALYKIMKTQEKKELIEKIWEFRELTDPPSSDQKKTKKFDSTERNIFQLFISIFWKKIKKQKRYIGYYYEREKFEINVEDETIKMVNNLKEKIENTNKEPLIIKMIKNTVFAYFLKLYWEYESEEDMISKMAMFIYLVENQIDYYFEKDLVIRKNPEYEESIY